MIVKHRAYLACEDTTANIRGVDIPIRAGITRVTEGHPLLENYGHLFREVEVNGPEVEQATAGPGEKRGA